MAEQFAADVQILEKGNIVFFYRPKKGVAHPKGPDDLERVYFMLMPDDQDRHTNRLFNVAHGVFPVIQPGKALPEERDWAFVQDVGHDPRAVLQELEKNVGGMVGGQRSRPWARAAGVGRYALACHQDHTHLVYFLNRPAEMGTVQKELEIKPEASYVISVKDPFVPSEIQLSEKPSYPENLKNKFDGHSWIPVDPASYLDYKYTQVLLIGARENVQKELGITLDSERENKAVGEVLQMLRQEQPEAGAQGVSLIEPLESGEWA